MPEMRKKSLLTPDESVDFEHGRMTSIRLGDLTVGHEILEPGWRWSVAPQAGRRDRLVHVPPRRDPALRSLDVPDVRRDDDGVRAERRVRLPPGHDSGCSVTSRPISLDWEGLRTWATPIGVGERVLLTILFTDIVDSTPTAQRIGELAWSDVLARHNEVVRRASRISAGARWRPPATASWPRSTGRPRLRCRDRRAGPARAPSGSTSAPGSTPARSTSSARRCAGSPSTRLPRLVAAAHPGEILVSELTRQLAAGSGLGSRTAASAPQGPRRCSSAVRRRSLGHRGLAAGPGSTRPPRPSC